MIFDQTLVDLFARSSHDLNPLHTSAEYARATAYGEPVVFGVLAGLAVLARVPGDANRRICRVEMSFEQPVVIGRPYDVNLTSNGVSCRGELRGAGGVAVTVTIGFAGPSCPSGAAPAGRPCDRAMVPPELPPPRSRPAHNTIDQLWSGLAVVGSYRASRLAELMAPLGLDPGPLPKGDLAALLWASYLAGMELPGRQSLLVSLAIDFYGSSSAGQGWYDAQVCHVDRRFNLVQVAGQLSEGCRAVAGVSFQALVRPDRRVIDPASVRTAAAALPGMTGQTAVIIGASRGLGAATAMMLAQLGCRVVGCCRMSHACASESALGGQTPVPAIQMLCGDAASAGFCTELAQAAGQRLGHVDMLVCCAGPALRPMRLRAGTSDELAGYVSASLRLVASPIAAFLPLLASSGGRLLVISTQAISAPPADWPHYVAAKGAIEHLVEALVPAHPTIRFSTFRPPRMDTDYVLPMVAAEPTVSPVEVAADIVRHLNKAARVTL